MCHIQASEAAQFQAPRRLDEEGVRVVGRKLDDCTGRTSRAFVMDGVHAPSCVHILRGLRACFWPDSLV